MIIYTGLFSPLLGFLVLMLFSYRMNRFWTNIIGCTTILISFLCFASFFGIDAPLKVTLFKWIPVEGIDADFSLTLDNISLLMTLIITGIGFLIHVYSTGYIEHEEDFARFFACLNFFVFAMLLLVLASNLLLLFVGWEGVGLASYLLIGYWYHRKSASQAATKAFVVNRIGDFGFLLGLLILFQTFGTSDIGTINQQAASLGHPLLTIVTLLLFMGATGKSAQLPLHTWLPDAMEGPTPVSALIHAATMVTAGVYLIVRMHPLFLLAPTTLQVIGVIGVTTSLFAALAAAGQTDLKRVLAYSTVSQLGLMFLACGAGAFYSAMFHLTTHAFMKSLLFLSAGNLVHMLHGTTDMGKMGGLSSKFPVTNWLFLIGVLAMSGLPPFAAFFSKDLILEQEYLSGYYTLFFMAIAASILTGFYLMRAYFLTFTGSPNLDEKILKEAKEAPKVMIAPLIILAILSIIGGLLGPLLLKFLREVRVSPAEQEELTHGFSFAPEVWMAIASAFVGVIAAILMYTQYRSRLGQPLAILKKAFYIDELYQFIFVNPLKALSSFITNQFETNLIDASIRTSAKVTQTVAIKLQRLQSGEIRSYAAWMVLGVVILIIQFVIGNLHA